MINDERSFHYVFTKDKILLCLEAKSLSFSDISRATGIPRATTHKYIKILLEKKNIHIKEYVFAKNGTLCAIYKYGPGKNAVLPDTKARTMGNFYSGQRKTGKQDFPDPSHIDLMSLLYPKLKK